eukprot:UN18646
MAILPVYLVILEIHLDNIFLFQFVCILPLVLK